MTETTRSANGRSENKSAEPKGAPESKSAPERKSAPPKHAGLGIDRVFTTGTHPYDEVTWERRDVVQTNWKTGEVVFEQ